jgi:hypothetical protein
VAGGRRWKGISVLGEIFATRWSEVAHHFVVFVDGYVVVVVVKVVVVEQIEVERGMRMCVVRP